MIMHNAINLTHKIHSRAWTRGLNKASCWLKRVACAWAGHDDRSLKTGYWSGRSGNKRWITVQELKTCARCGRVLRIDYGGHAASDYWLSVFGSEWMRP